MTADWSGKTVAILAGGPSLTAAQARLVALARLENRCRVIAVNDAVYLAWWADQLHGQDFKWWRAHIDRVQHYRGIKTTLDDAVPLAWASRLRHTGVSGFDPDPSCCRSGNNSGFQAIHVAIHSRAHRIVLLGFDLGGPHWFGGHAGEPVPDYDAVMAPHFKTLIPTLSERNIDVVNCSPSSRLACFRKGTLEVEL